MQAGAPSKQLGSAPLGPQTPELKRPTQRVLKYSPISVMQPGANTEVLVTGMFALPQAYLSVMLMGVKL